MCLRSFCHQTVWGLAALGATAFFGVQHYRRAHVAYPVSSATAAAAAAVGVLPYPVTRRATGSDVYSSATQGAVSVPTPYAVCV
jgi:hypothetical protein